MGPDNNSSLFFVVAVFQCSKYNAGQKTVQSSSEYSSYSNNLKETLCKLCTRASCSPLVQSLRWALPLCRKSAEMPEWWGLSPVSVIFNTVRQLCDFYVCDGRHGRRTSSFSGVEVCLIISSRVFIQDIPIDLKYRGLHP